MMMMMMMMYVKIKGKGKNQQNINTKLEATTKTFKNMYSLLLYVIDVNNEAANGRRTL